MNSTIPETSWKQGRLDARTGPRQLLFGAMYEDAGIELKAFPRGGRIFCIASAGCTAMQLARQHDVVAVDINPLQVDYLQRRQAGAPARTGRAEKLLSCARILGPLAGWRPSRVRAFLDLNEPREQVSFWRQHLDTRRFRAALALVFSMRVLRSRYSASFLDVLPAGFGDVIRRRMERCFARHANRANPYARALFLGEMPQAVPPSAGARPAVACADAVEFLESEPDGSFDGFTLSNILDGANDAYARRLAGAVKRAAAPGAIVVRRSFREPTHDLPENRAADDRAMIWGIVEVRPVETL